MACGPQISNPIKSPALENSFLRGLAVNIKASLGAWLIKCELN